jgi:colicin import membrane protein
MARAIQRLAEAHLVADEEASNRDAAERGDFVANRAEEAATKIEASADVAEAPTVLAEAVAETPAAAAAAAAAELLPSEASTDDASGREGETSGVVEVGLAAVAVSPVAAQLKARMKERLASALERAKAEAEGAAAARAEAARAEALATAAAPMTPLKSGTPAPKPDGSWEFVLE